MATFSVILDIKDGWLDSINAADRSVALDFGDNARSVDEVDLVPIVVASPGAGFNFG